MPFLEQLGFRPISCSKGEVRLFCLEVSLNQIVNILPALINQFCLKARSHGVISNPNCSCMNQIEFDENGLNLAMLDTNWDIRMKKQKQV